MHPLFGALPVPYVPVRVTLGAVIAHRYRHQFLAAEPRTSIGPLFSRQYLCGTILVAPYSMVWDWRVLRAGPDRKSVV